MSLYLDNKFLNSIAFRLEGFKRQDINKYNCRCPLCGDSATNKKKARGYFYPTEHNSLAYKCHNCGVSMLFGTFLKKFDAIEYKNYVLERYAAGEVNRKPHSDARVVVPRPAPTTVPTKRFAATIPTLDTLPDNHPAVVYALDRGIPKKKLGLLHYVENVAATLKPLFPRYEKLPSKSPRLAMPFYNEQGKITGVSLRAILPGDELRYMILRADDTDNAPLIFGLPHLDKTKSIYVVEGAIDSLFLPNCIACNGTTFGKIAQLGLPKEQVTIVIDNQPRNIEVCHMYEKYIDLGYRICIWPSNIPEKDLNEMANAGRNVRQLVRDNTYQGLAAKAAFSSWRKVDGLIKARQTARVHAAQSRTRT